MSKLPLHFGNIARHKSQSQQPGLWPDLGVSPIGIQGNVLHDLSGNKKTGTHYTATTAGTQGEYEIAASKFVLNCISANRHVRFPFELTQWPVTLFLSGVTSAADSCAVTIGNTGSDTESLGIQIYSSQVRGFLYSGSFNGFSGGSVSSGQYFTAALVIENNTTRRIYLNGVLVATDATDSDVIASGINALYISALARTSIAYYAGYYSTCAVYKRVLSPSQILTLSQDPLCWLRRKPMISLYVPVTTVRSDIFESPIFQSPVFKGVA